MIGGNLGAILQTLGICFLAVVLIIISVYTADFLGNEVERTIRNYKIKHRFKNPPIAKCYCMDCVQYEEKRGYCRCFSAYNMARNAFCVFAEPKKEDKQE